MRLKDQVVIVTGAGKGIGKVAAKMFAAEGARVAVASRTPVELEATVADIAATGGSAIALPTDIADIEAVQALVERVAAEWGQIDVLVNNAAMPGVQGRTQISLVDMPVEDWDLVHGINMRGTMLCSKFALPHMIERGRGSIINVSSGAGRRGLAGRTHYCSSKAGIIGFTKALAWDVAEHGVRVNCVVPGATMTELLEAYYQRLADEDGLTSEEVERREAGDSPIRRAVTSEEVAEVMVFLATDAASSIVGQSIDVGGGSWMS